MPYVQYLRVSSDTQDLSSQRLEIEHYADRKRLDIDNWIEVEMSSRRMTRERKIDDLINQLKRGDTLIVSELSRIARSMRETHNIMHSLAKKRIELHCIKQNLVTKGLNDMATKVFINAFAMAAEIERDLISQRTKNGLALAKQKGIKLGNPNLAADNKVRTDRAVKFAESLRGILEPMIREGYSQRRIVEELNRSNVKTVRGGQWSLVQLQRVINRLNMSDAVAA